MLFGEIDELEVMREGASDVFGGLHVERPDDLAHSRCGRPSPVAFSPRLGERANGLLEIEQRLAFLFDEGVTENVAQVRDVTAESVERVRHREGESIA